jgi:hypothetical protein
MYWGETGKSCSLPFTRGGLGRGKNLLKKGDNLGTISIENLVPSPSQGYGVHTS